LIFKVILANFRYAETLCAIGFGTPEIKDLENIEIYNNEK